MNSSLFGTESQISVEIPFPNSKGKWQKESEMVSFVTVRVCFLWTKPTSYQGLSGLPFPG